MKITTIVFTIIGLLSVSSLRYRSDSATGVVCAAGTFSTDGLNCNNCPIGSFSSSGATSCTPCQSGFYNNVVGSI